MEQEHLGDSEESSAYESNPETDKKATAEDLIRYTKPITTATAKAVAAGNSCRQEDVIAAANMGRKAVFDLLGVCKAAAATGETAEIRQRTIVAGRKCAAFYNSLLEQVNQIMQKPSHESKQNLTVLSRQVANAVAEIVQSAEMIKGSDWVDPDDPTVIAENELLMAASSIEAAAKKLSQLKPRQRVKEVDMNLDFEDQILEAAKSIAAATAALVKSASAAQKELVAQGKVAATYHKTDVDNDGQWSQGLISAARLVATATQSMCESANAMVQGQATEERLIASAKEVAGATAALLMACKVKAEPGSIAMQRLQAAGNAVKKATEALVKAAQQAKEQHEDNDNVHISQRMVGGMAQEIAAQVEILRLEKELNRAREKHAVIRKGRYRRGEEESSNDSSSAF
ncbi:hypothetical protein CHS0354_003045 [Potamilus streckersoni]|uniref:I/LWEQ domain-containing protein n=1 Tax=Potamilus streckersoni TaxID=2493646 RepID=A0AAE0WBK2_9BIVA|nr:hypothetical protein CHS0354_003045 [Potamilus streckersoni]